MAFENPRQISKHQTSKKVLEFNDQMAMASLEWSANLHAKYSKINVVIVDVTNGGGVKAIVTNSNLDPIVMKCLYEKVRDIKHDTVTNEEGTSSSSSELSIGIGTYKSLTPSEALSKYGEKAKESLNGLIPILEKNAEKYAINNKKIAQIKNAIGEFDKGTLAFTDKALKKTVVLLSETKINPNDKKKNEAGQYPVTVLKIEYNPNMDNCWTVFMENGWADKETYPNGGMSIKRGTYKKEKENKVVVSDDKFRQMVRQANDYIMLKEGLYMRKLDKLMEEQTENSY